MSKDSQTAKKIIKKTNLNGINQWLVIKKTNPTKPVLLFLHGGPGLPIFPLIPKYSKYTDLEKYFTVVYWEQRGTGKSYDHRNLNKKKMSINHFVDDVLNLAEMLKKEFDKDKIHLLGRSWGTVIGLIAAHRKPDLFHSFISIAQVVDVKRNDQISYEFTLNEAIKANDKNSVKKLKNIGNPPFSWQAMLIQRKILMKYGGYMANYQNKNWKVISQLIIDTCKTKEYNLLNLYYTISKSYFTLKCLIDEINDLNFIQQINSIEIPIFFLCGKKDYMVPHILSVEFYNQLDAKNGKELFLFNKSGHNPEFEDSKKFNKNLKKIVESIIN